MEHIISPPLILGKFIPSQRLQAILDALNRFYYSPAYLVTVAMLAILANVCSLELQIYTVYTLIYIVMCFICRDLTPLTPLVILCYIIPSNENNPGTSTTSIFFMGTGGEYVLFLAAVVIATLLIRLSFDPHINFKSIIRGRYYLLPGMLLLGLAYMIGGIGVPGYSELASKNIFFGFLQLVALALPYFVIASTIRWESVPKDYFVYVGTAVGFVLVAELANIYLTQGVIENNIVKRELIYTGWGIHNNIGGMLTMMLPFPFYFSCKNRSSIPGILAGTLMMAGIVLSNSRSSMLVGALLYGICVIVTLVMSKDKLGAFIAVSVLFLGAVGMCIIFWEKITSLFLIIAQSGLHANGRDEIYANGIRQFLKYPLFGGTFYPLDYVPYDFSEIDAFSSFFPPRWHNTIIQLLACCGIAGLSAYMLHCSQIFRVFSRKPSLSKSLIAISALALMVTSLFDCHFFNIGPVLFYSMSLTFAEKTSPPITRGKFERVN